MVDKTTSKGGNGSAERATLRAIAVQGDHAPCFFEQSNMMHRVFAPAGATSEDLESPDFLDLGYHTSNVRDGDLVHVFTIDWKRYWLALAIRGGLNGLQPRIRILPGFPMEIRGAALEFDDGIPAGYSLPFDRARGLHVPMFGEIRLNDGYPRREDARALIVHHRAKSASVPPRAPGKG